MRTEEIDQTLSSLQLHVSRSALSVSQLGLEPVEGKRESALLHEVNVHPFAVLSRYFYLFIRPCTSVPTVCICSRARGPGRRGHTLARAARAHAAAKLAACSAGRSEASVTLITITTHQTDTTSHNVASQHAAYHKGRVLGARPFLDAFFGRTSLGLPSQAVASGSSAATSGGADTYRPALP